MTNPIFKACETLETGYPFFELCKLMFKTGKRMRGMILILHERIQPSLGMSKYAGEGSLYFS